MAVDYQGAPLKVSLNTKYLFDFVQNLEKDTELSLENVEFQNIYQSSWERKRGLYLYLNAFGFERLEFSELCKGSNREFLVWKKGLRFSILFFHHYYCFLLIEKEGRNIVPKRELLLFSVLQTYSEGRYANILRKLFSSSKDGRDSYFLDSFLGKDAFMQEEKRSLLFYGKRIGSARTGRRN